VAQPSWLARHRAEVAAAGAALAATAVGTQAKKIQAFAGQHPRATIAIGGLAGAASGAALGVGSGAAVEALVTGAADRVSDAADTVASLTRELAQNRALTVAGGAVTGAALGVALGYLLQRRAWAQAAEGAGSPSGAGDQSEAEGKRVTQVPEGWLQRLQFWAAHRNTSQASGAEQPAAAE
jgi:hypothetical protein